MRLIRKQRLLSSEFAQNAHSRCWCGRVRGDVALCATEVYFGKHICANQFCGMTAKQPHEFIAETKRPACAGPLPRQAPTPLATGLLPSNENGFSSIPSRAPVALLRFARTSSLELDDRLSTARLAPAAARMILDLPVLLGLEHVLHLHRFDHRQLFASLDLLSDMDRDFAQQPRHRGQQEARHVGRELLGISASRRAARGVITMGSTCRPKCETR